jgi:hypothetical protein
VLGFLSADGHARVYYGTRKVQKTHVARLKFPAPATIETWVTDQDGDPVFMVVAEPSDSLAGEGLLRIPQIDRLALRLVISPRHRSVSTILPSRSGKEIRTYCMSTCVPRYPHHALFVRLALTRNFNLFVSLS